MLYPWQIDDYNNLVSAYNNRKFQTLLIYGAANSAPEEVIHKFIDYLLCVSPNGIEACGKCASCRIRHDSDHPDFYLLAADESEERKTLLIKVEEVRKVTEFAMMSLHMANHKVIFLPDAGQLNLSSANALLKIIEEPPVNCIFILQSANVNKLLPTILSRCFKFQLKTPERNLALQYLYERQVENAEFWLNYFGGEPVFDIPVSSNELILLQEGLLKPSVDNIFSLSNTLDPKKIGMTFWVDYLGRWLSDIARVKLGGTPAYFSIVGDSLARLVGRVNDEKLYALQDELIFLSEWAEHPLNHKLQLENLLFRYQQIYV